jgi:general secretion pathway protein D
MKTNLFNRALSLTLLSAGLATTLVAQFDSGGGSMTSSESWRDMKFNSKTRIKLSYRNANIDLVLDMFSKASGITIVKDPSLTGPISITSANQVDLKTGFQILEKTLDLKGFDLKRDGQLLIIRKRDQGNRGNGMNQMPSFDPSMFQQPQSKLKIYPIKFANATQVSRVVNEVFAQAGQTQNPFQSMFGGGGGGFQGFGGGGNRFGRGGGGGFNFQSLGGFGRGQQGSSVRASADDFSNSVIVNAPDKEQGEVERVIRQIDKETDQPQRTKVFKLEFAGAQEVAATVQNVLTNNAPRGRGGVTSSGSNFGDRIQQAVRFGSTQAAFGTVATDLRTNSLVVTATDESLLIVENVIKELDKPVDFENTTFVFPLNNARADDIANLLNNSFGQRQGVNRNNRVQSPAQQRQNTGNNTRAQGGTRAGVDQIDPNFLALEMAQDGATEGELMTNISAQFGGGFGQFGGGGFGGGFNRQNQGAQTQTGRTADGRLVPVRDLTGQITAIPDPNTNSIIIVGNPDSAVLIKQVLEQLDRIPEQVMIETIIVEANLTATDRLGVEWNYVDRAHLGTTGQTGNIGTNFGQATASPALQGFRYTIGGQNLTSFLNAIQTDRKFNVLSTPRIFTSNNTQAQINISQRIPYIISSRTDNNGNILNQFDFQDVGIVLTVTPRITANGYVTMDVNQTANDLEGFTNFNAPIINQREADTVVSVKNGETIILGGIIRNTVTTTNNKVPVLGDIPLLGSLFKTRTREESKTELLVLLTPRIVKDENDARELRKKGTNDLSLPSKQLLERVLPPENTKKEVKDNKDPKDPAKKSGGNK